LNENPGTDPEIRIRNIVLEHVGEAAPGRSSDRTGRNAAGKRASGRETRDLTDVLIETPADDEVTISQRPPAKPEA
jgi:hypothetical protein